MTQANKTKHALFQPKTEANQELRDEVTPNDSAERFNESGIDVFLGTRATCSCPGKRRYFNSH